MSERRVALVSGASSGIGAGVARRLATEGAAVLVCGRDEERCEGVSRQIEAEGGVAWSLPFDLADPAATGAAMERARALCAPVGPISWLVNNAGVVRTAPLLPREGESNDELFDLHLALNLHAARRLIESLVPDMIERGYGRVVNVASSAALRGYPYAAAYAASKHALLGYSLVACEELRETAVGLNPLSMATSHSRSTGSPLRRRAWRTTSSWRPLRASLRAKPARPRPV